MGRKNYFILWTVNFDAGRPRSKGRKVPLSLAVRSPTIDEIVTAVERLGLRCEVRRDKKYPKAWFEDAPQGYVAVYKVEGWSKARLLREVARVVRQLRSSSRP